MPINVPNNLPAIQELKNENIFIMEELRAWSGTSVRCGW